MACVRGGVSYGAVATVRYGVFELLFLVVGRIVTFERREGRIFVQRRVVENFSLMSRH